MLPRLFDLGRNGSKSDMTGLSVASDFRKQCKLRGKVRRGFRLLFSLVVLSYLTVNLSFRSKVYFFLFVRLRLPLFC